MPSGDRNFEQEALVNLIVARVVDQIAPLLPVPRRPVLPLELAWRYVGCKSKEAFFAWKKRYRVRSCAHGRYDTRELEVAMEREARHTYVHTGGGKAVA